MNENQLVDWMEYIDLSLLEMDKIEKEAGFSAFWRLKETLKDGIVILATLAAAGFFVATGLVYLVIKLRRGYARSAVS